MRRYGRFGAAVVDEPGAYDADCPRAVRKAGKATASRLAGHWFGQTQRIYRRRSC